MAFELHNPLRYRRSRITSVGVIFLFALIVSVIAPQTAQALIYGIGCGPSRVATLINVINEANSNGSDDTINLTAGCTYTLTAPDNQTDGANGLPVIVSGHGTLTINGNGATIQRSTSSVLTFRILESHAHLTLNDLTLTKGFVFDGSGGAILSDSTLTLNNTTVSNSEADWGGHLSENGGGIAIISGGTLTLNNSTVSGNTMSNGDGGGIAVEQATLTVNNSTIRGNNTDDSGGGINVTGTATIRNSTIENNVAAANGAGINFEAELQSSNLRIISSIINNNTSSDQGGGIFASGPTTLLDSTISNNAAPNGAGAYVDFFRLVVTNDTFYGNAASSDGGGIYNGNLLTLTNSTFSGNSASGSGGALYNSAGHTATLNNSILGNSSDGGDCVQGGGTVTANHTLIEDAVNHCDVVNGSNGNIIGQHPFLGALTGSPKYYPLRAPSPAINAGDNTLLHEATVNVDLNGDGDKTDTINTDQPGNPRVRGGTVDMGAVESSVIPTPILNATKSVSGTFAVASTVTYIITISNNGEGSQPNNPGHEFSDTLPPQLTLVSVTASSGTAASSGATVTWDGSIPPDAGSVTITITTTINAGTAGQTVSNQGTVHYDADANGTNESSIVTDDPNTAALLDPTDFVVDAPAVSASKTAVDTNGGVLVPGDKLEYTITINNSGSADATNVMLTDAIPANTTYVAHSTTLNGAPIADNGLDMPFAAGGSIGDIASNDNAVIVFDVIVNNPLPNGVTSVSNLGTVSGANFSPVSTNNGSPLVSPVIIGLTILKAFGATHLAVGASTSLSFTAINPPGEPALTGLSFSDVLPNGLVFSGTPLSAQCGGTVSLSNSFTLSFSGGSLGAGLSTCTIDAAVTADGTVSGMLNNLSSIITADGGVSSANGASASIVVDAKPTTIPAAGPTAVPAVFFQCENLASQSDGAMTSSGGIGAVHSGASYGNVYCHIIAQDGHYVTSSAEIGIESVINLGVEQAVDVFGELPSGDTVVPFDASVQICLRGNGEVLFLNAADAGRTVQRLAAIDQNGYRCVSLLGSGTVILVGGASGLGAPAPASATPPPSVELANCRVTTTNAPLNLRAEPDTAAAVLAQLPYNLTLTATEHVPGWYRVIYLDGQGWVSATYLSFAGDCGQ